MITQERIDELAVEHLKNSELLSECCSSDMDRDMGICLSCHDHCCGERFCGECGNAVGEDKDELLEHAQNCEPLRKFIDRREYHDHTS